MNDQRQVCHIQPMKSISAGEDREHQRRWTEQQWQRKAENKKFNYDKTRSRLNFEVLRGGKIAPLGSFKPVIERFHARLEELGISDPNKGSKEPHYRVACNMVLSGSRERIRQMAFGNAKVNYEKGADNSHVERQQDIEKWATDMYKAVADKWGEENIIDFSVHLDETSPHIHCVVMPIVYDEKRQRMAISYAKVFGGDRNVLNAVHDYFAEVNEKWGLERGESVDVTGARHIQRDEYYATLKRRCRELDGVVRQKERAIRGLNTMIANLQEERQQVEGRIAALEEQLRQGGEDKADLQKQIASLREMLSTVNTRLTDKQEKYEEVKNQLRAYRDMARAHQQDIEKLKTMRNATSGNMERMATSILYAAMFRSLLQTSRHICNEVSEAARLAEDTLIDDAMYMRFDDVLSTAVRVFINGIDGATGITQTGGGGTSNDMPWRDKDEDLMDFARRCMRYAHNKHYPGNVYGRRR